VSRATPIAIVAILGILAASPVPSLADDSCIQAGIHLDVAKDAEHDMETYLVEHNFDAAEISEQTAAHELNVADSYNCADVDTHHEWVQIATDATDASFLPDSFRKIHGILYVKNTEGQWEALTQAQSPSGSVSAGGGKFLPGSWCAQHPKDPDCHQ
jgi:histidinol dehydrogenase